MNITFTNCAAKAKQFLNLLQGYTKGIRITAILILLLMGVNNAWAGEGFYGIYIKYNHNGTAKTSDGEWTNPLNLGTLTSDFKVTDVYLKVWWENWSPTMSAQLHYWKDGNEQWSGTFKNVKSTGGNNREVYVENWNKVLASTTETSGSHEITYKWEAYFSSVTHTLPSSGTKKITYTVAPPAVKSFTVTHSGDVISGSGEQADPYIIRYNGSLTLTLSGSQNHTDANSTIQYNASGTWNTTATKTISSVTTTTVQNVTVKARYTNKTDANLNGAESSKTIYYRAENAYTVTVNNDGHGTTTPSGAQSNVGQVTGLSIKATPAANYEFVNWTITSGSGSFGSATSASTTFKPTSAATIQANFRSTATNSLTVVAGANIASVTGSTNPVTLGNTYAITATPKTGYTFSTWTADPAANATFGSATANTTVTVKNGSVTVTASAVERMSTLTTSNSYTAGDPGYAIPTKSVDEIGIATTATITAATPNDKYTFIGWELSNCTRTDGGADNAFSITVRSTNGDGADAKVTAKYEQIPMVTLYLKPNSNWKTANARFAAYAFGNGDKYKWIDMIELGCTGIYTCDIPKTYPNVIFCRMNPSNSTNNWDGGNKWNQTSNLTIPTNENNLYTVAEGTWDNGSDNWSTYAATCDIITNAGEGGKITVSPSSSVDINTDVTITIVPNEGYAFASGDITIGTQAKVEITETTTNATICGPTTINATFSRIQYNVNYGVCSDTQWGSIALNSGSAITTTSSTTLDYGTQVILVATPNTGYQIEGWYSNSACTTPIDNGTNNTYTVTITGGTNVYVKFVEIPANSHNITYTEEGTGWTYGAKPTSAEEGATVTFEVIPTTGYTVTVTSSDVSLSNNGNTYTFTMPTTDVAIEVSATEKTHDVTISYKCSDQPIQANGTATAVGEITPKEITAPEITGYKFTSWTLDDGITNKSDNTTTNPINITTKESGTYTLTANYEEVVTVYFVNSSKWSTVTCHHWHEGGSGTSWPGDQLTTTGETVNEFDVYKATFTSEHDMCIFNNNGGGQQTENLEVQDGKYYYLLKNKWYDSLNDIPAIDPLATNVFIAGGMNGWSTNTDEFRKATKEATTASIILNLTEGTYKFKIMDNGTWLGNNGTISSTISGWTFANSDGDCTLKANIAGDYTFTWEISTKKLSVTYPTIYAITATPNEAAMGTIEGAGNYGKGSTATLTATPNDGYLFVNWTKGGEVVATTQEYSFTVTEAVALVANFEAAPEEVHNVTVSYVCGGNKIAEDQTVAAVGVTTAKTVEAPEIWGYTFSSWTLGEDVTSANELTSNTIDINIVPDGSDYTLTANYTEIPKVTVYFVNNKKWSKVYAYGWGGSVGENPAWPGQDITANKEAEQIVGFDVYSYSVVPGSYDNIIFNKGEGGEGNQTETFKWIDGKYYYMGADADYTGGTKDEVTTAVTPYALATDIYLAGSMTDWETNKIEFKRVAIDATTATVTAELTEDQTYEFKIIESGNWLGNSGTMTRDDCTGWVFRQKKDDGENDEDNGKIYADASGEYIFTWDLETKKLSVIYPAPTAKYIYFKNNPGWNKVYVYFFKSENFGDLGASSYELTIENKRVAAMTRIENTDIWQYEYGTTGITPSNVIAFTEASQPNYDNFHDTKAVYRSDFNKKMELFIPQKTSNETKNGTKYYSKGVWMKYNATESGYSLDVTDEQNKPDFTTENVGGYVFSTTIRLNASKTYKFKIPNVKGDEFATSKSITFAKNNNDVELTTDVQDDVTIKTNTAGVYTFMIDLSSGKLKLSVDYPLANGDYRLAYKENDGTKNTKFHPAQYIRKVTEDTKLDIVSFYINKEGKNRAIVLQQATVDNAGKVKWNNVDSTLITLSTIESGVYNVALQQTNEGSHQATILCNDETYPQPYTGNYYIRTDAANGGWGFYEQETNQMEYTNLNADYDHYYCKWFNNPTGNVRFVVANDYSECVSDTMTTDTFLDGGEKLLGESANVRYAWSSKTNTTSRAYLAGSGSNDEYLTISGTNIYTDDVTPQEIVKSKFVDQNNWVYALDIKAKNGAVIDVKAVYKGKESTFIDDKNIMSIQDDKYYTLRVIYNFKTNNMVSSWLLQDVEQNMALSADIMMIRKGQGSPNQLKLNGHSISGDHKTVYGVMQFDKLFITNSEKSIEERGLYWISFPFDVKLVDVFGLGEYGTAWIIQYYDGAERAQKGWFQETATFWKYVMPEDRKNFVLEANVGYGLALDIEAIDWPNDIDQQNLYFPSAEKIETISTELTSTSVDVPAHTCTIERDDRKTLDSHWNVIGVPSYADAEDVVSPDGLKFLYEWNPQDNTLSVSEATTHTFKAMHSYMVQFAGTIDWEHKNIAPAALAAKAPAKESTLLQLTLTEGDKQLDQTYVELTDEATAAFDMNMDLTKFFNTGHANIYSCIQTVPVAANMLPVQSVQVPLGIQVVKEGSYTIALPASVDAALVTLIDNQTQTHTCLNTSDYTVTLPAGTYENRFFLAVEPQRVVTSNPANKQDTAPMVKFIKDGQLYILHQGVIYDAQGRR